jgi:hypothetical protein
VARGSTSFRGGGNPRHRAAKARARRHEDQGGHLRFGCSADFERLNATRAQADTCMSPVPSPAAPVARRLHGMTFVARCQSRDAVLD